jgi:hypothetical protein
MTATELLSDLEDRGFSLTASTDNHKLRIKPSSGLTDHDRAAIRLISESCSTCLPPASPR